MRTAEDLRRELVRIDGKGYKAYRDVAGAYDLGEFVLYIDYVQGDPYASPSRLRVRVPQEVAGFPSYAYRTDARATGVANYLARVFGRVAKRVDQARGTGSSGYINIDAPGQQVLQTNAMIVTPEYVEARFTVGLPARGRKILGYQATYLLLDDVPEVVARSLYFHNHDADIVRRHADVNEDAEWLRDQLERNGLVAFVADDAVLPRRSGIDDHPLEDGIVVPFESPGSLHVSFDLPNSGQIAGMGVPEGVTLIVGGGYHGKSTLLRALERGVYNHCPGDGRELVITVPDAVKIRAEDGRSVVGVSIRPFIANLPYGQDTAAFSSLNASGSTSQAANIIEALEAGASLLLIDEDTSATNFMIRDHRMQELIAREQEPITPFIDKVRQLYDDHGVSTVLVIGGSGDYFDVADTVIAMNEYRPWDATQPAKQVAKMIPTGRLDEGGDEFGDIIPRAPRPESVDPSQGRRSVKIKVHDRHTVQFGQSDIDLSAVEQIVDSSQTRAIAEALVLAKRRYMDGDRTVAEILDHVMADIEREGLDVLLPYTTGDLAMFRRHELAAALNRLRTLAVHSK